VILAVLVIATGCNTGSHALVFTPTELSPAVAGRQYSASVTISGNDTPVGGVSVSAGALPDGLQVSLETGGQGGATNAFVIGGTPTRAGTYDFTLMVWCLGTNVSGQTGEQRYTMVVS